jgi:four helix bundle protein
MRRGVAVEMDSTTPTPTAPPYQIAERAFEFSCDVVRLCQQLGRRDWIAQHVAGQLLAAGTSVGANVEEAQAPASVRDFVSRAGIALRECRESRFWLRLISACELAPDLPVDRLTDEARQLTAILTVMVRNSRAKLPKPRLRQSTR